MNSLLFPHTGDVLTASIKSGPSLLYLCVPLYKWSCYPPILFSIQPFTMFGKVLVFLLLSANLNALPTEVENSEVAQKVAGRIEFLEMELQSMYDRNGDSKDILQAENELSTLYNEEERSIICAGCKFIPFIAVPLH